jgi:hypothetical protein
LNSIKELEDGMYPEDRISREIEIIKNIAVKNNLLGFFENVLQRSYRNGRSPLQGNAISPRLIYLDGKDFKVNNVFEASFFIQNCRNIFPKLGLSLLFRVLSNSLRYKLLSFKKRSKLTNYV